jgi:hypothetical protein
MSTSLIRRAILIAGIVLLPLTGRTASANANEQIVLPFDCSVAGGRVQMRPASDQAYRIYGARRQEQYRACSEQNPDRCRSFLVHSFTMACGRDRVAWPDVYAAIAKVTDGRAFYNADGRLYYRMGPREPRASYPFPDARRPATGIVEMPDGFAPMAGVDAIFTPLDPRVAELDEAPPSDARAYRDVPPVEKPSFAPAMTPKSAEKQKPVDAPKIAEAQKLVEPPKSEVVLEPKPPQPEPLETASTDSAQPAPAEASRSDTKPQAPDAAAPVTSTILNNPVAKGVETASKTETVVAAAEMASSPRPAASADQPARVEGWNATGGPGPSIPPIAFAILIAAATLTILFVILKRQAGVPMAAGPLRVPIEHTLPGLDPPSASPTGQTMTVREAPEPPALSNTAATSTGMPQTRQAALTLLGLSTGATDAAIRKVVEALRQSWHPDLASDDADRAAREERIKAINVASDILLRKTAA